MRRLSSDLRHALASEYVLGTLGGAARRRFEALALEDRALADLVRRWESFLTPLAGRVAPVEPPARLWRAIEARLAARAGPAPSLWSSLAFWRALGAGLAAAVIAILALLVATPPRPDAEPMMVAVLAAANEGPRMIVEQKSAGVLKLRMVKPWAAMASQDLELWVLPAGGRPRSLGVVAHDRDSEIRLASLDATLRDGVAIAISREPRGGSPTGQPTGPVVCSGAIARAKRA